MRHLLDMYDLYEDEINFVVHVEESSLQMISELREQNPSLIIDSSLTLYESQIIQNLKLLKQVCFHQFLVVDHESKNLVLDQMMENYLIDLSRTLNEDVVLEECMMTVLQMILYKISLYKSLMMHSKLLHCVHQLPLLSEALKSEKEMEKIWVELIQNHDFFD